MKKLLLVTALVGLALPVMAATVSFDLIGKAGAGLQAGNENGTINGIPGLGGEIGAGITFDTTTSMLTLNVGWGSGNGFINLTGPTTGGHLHGPTTSGGVAAFTQNASVKYPLDSLAGWNTSASAGMFVGTIAIVPADVNPLLNGQFYFNVHTSANGGGEIRGNLVVVPEPSTAALALVGAGAALGLWGWRRYRAVVA